MRFWRPRRTERTPCRAAPFRGGAAAEHPDGARANGNGAAWERHAAFNAIHGEAAAAPGHFGFPSLAALLTGHILQDGELVLIILKPSRWFILLSTLRFAAVVAILMIGSKVFDEHLPGRALVYVEIGALLIAGRFFWATLQWMGRLYILTDLRIVRLEGVFSIDIYDCPLRKVARTRLLFSTRERLTRLGTVEIQPADDDMKLGYWQMIRRPQAVHDQIVAAINRARQGGPGCHV